MAVVELGPGYDSGLDPGLSSRPDFRLDFLEIKSVGGIHVVLSTLSLSFVVYSYPCDAHSPCGTRNTWCCPL